jgi:uncharacterized membrane protein YbhN (UPF0104 family)
MRGPSSISASTEIGSRAAARETHSGLTQSAEREAKGLDDRQLRPRVTRRIATLLLSMALAISLLTSVPSLRPVVRTIGHIDPIWVVVAIALELASCVSFVVLFPVFFDRLRPREARRLAWTEQASGALLPGGGAGGLAIGGWLIHLTGAPTDWIIRRSGGLFFLTTAVNGAAIISCGLLLSTHVAQPHGFTLTMLPAGLALAVTLPVAALPRILRSRANTPRWVAAISAGVLDAMQTTFGQPSWRLMGAFGYLGFDMAVLWVTLHAVGEHVSIPALVLAYNIGYLANAVPIPGGIGVLDAGLASSLLLYGVSPAHVTAAVLVYHAIALWIPGLGGTLAYLRVRVLLREGPKSDQPDVSTHRPLTPLAQNGGPS